MLTGVERHVHRRETARVDLQLYAIYPQEQAIEMI